MISAVRLSQRASTQAVARVAAARFSAKKDDHGHHDNAKSELARTNPTYRKVLMEKGINPETLIEKPHEVRPDPENLDEIKEKAWEHSPEYVGYHNYWDKHGLQSHIPRTHRQHRRFWRALFICSAIPILLGLFVTVPMPPAPPAVDPEDLKKYNVHQSKLL